MTASVHPVSLDMIVLSLCECVSVSVSAIASWQESESVKGEGRLGRKVPTSSQIPPSG